MQIFMKIGHKKNRTLFFFMPLVNVFAADCTVATVYLILTLSELRTLTFFTAYDPAKVLFSTDPTSMVRPLVDFGCSNGTNTAMAPLMPTFHVSTGGQLVGELGTGRAPAAIKKRLFGIC